MDIRELPAEVTTVQQFNKMAFGMVENLHNLRVFTGCGAYNAKPLGCQLSWQLDNLAARLLAIHECENVLDLPGHAIVPEELVAELMTLKKGCYDPYIQAIAN